MRRYSMVQRNADIRDRALKSGIRLWQIAESLGINDGNLSRKLRRELPPDEKKKILSIIDILANGGEGIA